MRYLIGFVCVLALGVMGCSETTGTECETPADCPGDLCTVPDQQDCVGGACTYEPIVCGDDFSDCTGGPIVCNPAVGCEATPLADGTLCAGGTCQAGVCELTGSVLPCTEQGIRNAIAAGGEVPYTFNCDGATTVVTEATIVIDNSVILDGEGNLTIDGGGEAGSQEGVPHTIFDVPEGVEAELRMMTVTRRFCVPLGVTVNGPAIENSGTLTLANLTLSENCGAFENSGTLMLTNSTVSDNEDGIGNQRRPNETSSGTLMITNSTVSGNGTWGIRSDGTLMLTNSTVSDNEVVVNGGTATLTNSLIDGDCSIEGVITSLGYNIESPGNTCGFDQTGDRSGVSAVLLDLQPLANNGGPTQTHAITTDSAAFNTGTCEVDEDQRGVTRPQGSACDVGAFELEQ